MGDQLDEDRQIAANVETFLDEADAATAPWSAIETANDADAGAGAVTIASPEGADDGADDMVAAALAQALGLEIAASEPEGEDEPGETAISPVTESREPTLNEIVQQAIAQQLGPLQQLLSQQQTSAYQQQAELAYQSFMEGLDEMTPEDAAATKTALLTDFAAQLLGERTQQAQAQQLQVQYEDAFQFIAKGGRLVQQANGEWVKAPSHAKPLSEAEQQLLRYVRDSPRSMQSFADQTISRRQQQTAAARTALADRRRAAGDGAGPTGSGGARGEPAKEPQTLDELLDMADAMSPRQKWVTAAHR